MVASANAVVLISLLGIPITYFVNWAQDFHGEKALFWAGTACLLLMLLLTYVFVVKKGHSSDRFYYVLILGMFAGVVDLIISLENDGYITGFMTIYLKTGEPYLHTVYGTMICYWDGIGHYAMYLIMIYSIAYRKNYREVGLYWVGSIGHSMIVLLLGCASGMHGTRWSTMLNVPYIFVPLIGAVKFISQRPQKTISKQSTAAAYTSIWKRPVDILFILAFCASIAVALLRGLAVLGSTWSLSKLYLAKYEPLLNDPLAFPKIQMITYLFYFLLYYGAAIYGLVWPGQDWMSDWSLLAAGAAAQAQIAHIGTSVHARTPLQYQLPADPNIRLAFWVINGGLLLVPQLFAMRCVRSDTFFTPVIKRGPKKME